MDEALKVLAESGYGDEATAEAKLWIEEVCHGLGVVDPNEVRLVAIGYVNGLMGAED